MPDTLGDTHQSLADLVYLRLRERIIEGEYPAGQRLVERELAEGLGVSRIPLREAMQRLEREGFLTAQARRGAVVADFGPEEAEHFFAVRESLEALAASLAAQHATAAGVRGLERLLARTRKAAEAGRLRETVSLNADFHREIVELSGNPLLRDMMAPLDGRLRRLFRLTSDAETSLPMCTEHQQLLDAIKARDPETAAALARHHVAGTRAFALQALGR
ncbi:GntR family transcriptional regulator [Kitasatospora cheerisanensis]|uniref:GntR family transcriptional regulator n=1 Tax=Kitasatospora cheerisanensis KCTC 2395 TaxID=1348663 RepID=A0A066YSP3_9ACTN|nr:GntR family transcriptional regulator [Kitasatospora cheerisanensis]KDN84573.1 GntR family transcriptional regulator [Kitasatospora cheerisanensis KCTC 2395]